MEKFVVESHGRDDPAMKACVLFAIALARKHNDQLCILVPTWGNVDNTYVSTLFGASAMKRFHARKPVAAGGVSIVMESQKTFNPMKPYAAVALIFPSDKTLRDVDRSPTIASAVALPWNRDADLSIWKEESTVKWLRAADILERLPEGE